MHIYCLDPNQYLYGLPSLWGFSLVIPRGHVWCQIFEDSSPIFLEDLKNSRLAMQNPRGFEPVKILKFLNIPNRIWKYSVWSIYAPEILNYWFFSMRNLHVLDSSWILTCYQACPESHCYEFINEYHVLKSWKSDSDHLELSLHKWL